MMLYSEEFQILLMIICLLIEFFNSLVFYVVLEFTVFMLNDFRGVTKSAVFAVLSFEGNLVFRLIQELLYLKWWHTQLSWSDTMTKNNVPK